MAFFNKYKNLEGLTLQNSGFREYYHNDKNLIHGPYIDLWQGVERSFKNGVPFGLYKSYGEFKKENSTIKTLTSFDGKSDEFFGFSGLYIDFKNN